MYLDLSDIFEYFESITIEDNNYLNINDYHIYSQAERNNLTGSNIIEQSDFLLLPKIGRNEIVAKYLVQKNNKKLLSNKGDEDFFYKFHWYIEDNHLVDEWQNFEKRELMNFAANWCEQNDIKFTLKT